jgi:hypothetical protein
MVVAAEFGTGQVLWSIVWFSLFFMWIWLVISVLGSIFTSPDLSGGAKAMWTIGVIVLPYLGVFMYLIVRGDAMAQNAAAAAEAQDDAMRSYIRNAAGGSGTADELSRIADLHAGGSLDDAEYAAAKANILGS